MAITPNVRRSRQASLQRADGTPSRIMVVEKELLRRLTLEGWAQKQGAVVLSGAETGAEAIVRAETARPDVILMGISLNGAMDGITAAERILRGFPVSLVFLASAGDEGTRRRIAALKGAELLVRPIQPDKMLDAVIRVSGADGTPKS